MKMPGMNGLEVGTINLLRGMTRVADLIYSYLTFLKFRQKGGR